MNTLAKYRHFLTFQPKIFSFQPNSLLFRCKSTTKSKRKTLELDPKHFEEKNNISSPEDLLEYLSVPKFQHRHSNHPWKHFVVKELVQVGRHVKITSSGRVQSFSALIFAGDGQGTAGIGRGKGTTVGEAILRACREVQKNLITIERYRDRSLFGGPYRTKWNKTRVELQPLDENSGRNCSTMLDRFLHAFGVNDVRVVVRGRRNKFAILACIVELLQKFTTPDKLARRLGKKMFNNKKKWKPFRDYPEHILKHLDPPFNPREKPDEELYLDPISELMSKFDFRDVKEKRNEKYEVGEEEEEGVEGVEDEEEEEGVEGEEEEEEEEQGIPFFDSNFLSKSEDADLDLNSADFPFDSSEAAKFEEQMLEDSDESRFIIDESKKEKFNRLILEGKNKEAEKILEKDYEEWLDTQDGQYEYDFIDESEFPMISDEFLKQTKQFVKDFDKMDEKTKSEIRQAIEEMEEE